MRRNLPKCSSSGSWAACASCLGLVQCGEAEPAEHLARLVG